MTPASTEAPAIWLAESDADLWRCFPALKVLRPHLEASTFLAQVRRQQPAGYRLAATGGPGAADAVAGFRLAEFLAWGKVLYVDDLITLPG